MKLGLFLELHREVHICGLESNNLTTIGWTAVKLVPDIQAPQRMRSDMTP